MKLPRIKIMKSKKAETLKRTEHEPAFNVDDVLLLETIDHVILKAKIIEVQGKIYKIRWLDTKGQIEEYRTEKFLLDNLYKNE